MEEIVNSRVDDRKLCMNCEVGCINKIPNSEKLFCNVCKRHFIAKDLAKTYDTIDAFGGGKVCKFCIKSE